MEWNSVADLHLLSEENRSLLRMLIGAEMVT